MMQKLKNDALWCKSAKNLAICFIYEASINLWCDLTTLHKSLISHAILYKLLCLASSVDSMKHGDSKNILNF